MVAFPSSYNISNTVHKIFKIVVNYIWYSPSTKMVRVSSAILPLRLSLQVTVVLESPNIASRTVKSAGLASLSVADELILARSRARLNVPEPALIPVSSTTQATPRLMGVPLHTNIMSCPSMKR